MSGSFLFAFALAFMIDQPSLPPSSPQHWSVQNIPTYVLATNIWQVFRIVDSL